MDFTDDFTGAMIPNEAAARRHAQSGSRAFPMLRLLVWAAADLQHEMKSVWCLWCVWWGFLFSEDGQPCIIDHKTLLRCRFISPAQLTGSWALFLQVSFSDGLLGFACVVPGPPPSPTSYYTELEAKQCISSNNSICSFTSLHSQWGSHQKVMGGRDKPWGADSKTHSG